MKDWDDVGLRKQKKALSRLGHPLELQIWGESFAFPT
jgi:hypothetical protein